MCQVVVARERLYPNAKNGTETGQEPLESAGTETGQGELEVPRALCFPAGTEMGEESAGTETGQGELEVPRASCFVLPGREGDGTGGTRGSPCFVLRASRPGQRRDRGN